MGSDETAKSGHLRLEERERIRARGMTFEVFLPRAIANWLRGKIAAGVYANPAAAAFRRELLKATVDGSSDKPHGHDGGLRALKIEL